MKTVISLRNGEREALLDAFSMCNTYLHEEASIAAQYFNDFNGYCPNNIALCEPLETINEEEENFMFLMALESFGITSAHDLAEQSGASDRDCIELWETLLGAMQKRGRVLSKPWITALHPIFGIRRIYMLILSVIIFSCGYAGISKRLINFSGQQTSVN